MKVSTLAGLTGCRLLIEASRWASISVGLFLLLYQSEVEEVTTMPTWSLAAQTTKEPAVVTSSFGFSPFTARTRKKIS